MICTTWIEIQLRFMLIYYNYLLSQPVPGAKEQLRMCSCCNWLWSTCSDMGSSWKKTGLGLKNHHEQYVEYILIVEINEPTYLYYIFYLPAPLQQQHSEEIGGSLQDRDPFCAEIPTCKYFNTQSDLRNCSWGHSPFSHLKMYQLLRR